MNMIIDILHLEDDPADAELVQAALAEAGLACRITRVRTRDEFETGLGNDRTDIILANYRLPMYDGMSALGLAHERGPEIPFIFVSGTMGEEAAIEALTQGATDYVLKQNLSRLAPAVQRALQEARNRREHRQAQEALQRSNEMLRAIIEAAPVAIIGLDLDGHVQSVWNPAAEKMLGWRAQEVMGRPLPTVPADHQEEFGGFREQIRRGLALDGMEVCRQRRDGTPIDYSIYASPLHDAQGRIGGSIARAGGHDRTQTGRAANRPDELRPEQHPRGRLHGRRKGAFPVRQRRGLPHSGILPGRIAHHDRAGCQPRIPRGTLARPLERSQGTRLTHLRGAS